MKLAVAAQQKIRAKLGDKKSIIQSELDRIQSELDSGESLTDDRIQSELDRIQSELDRIQSELDSGESLTDDRIDYLHDKKRDLLVNFLLLK